MDCRTFRSKHVAFVDDTLPGVELVQMEHHRAECASCAERDADVRRSLLLFRNNLPTIEPSADFSTRLASRLAQEQRRHHMAAPLIRGPGVPGFLSISLGVIAVGFAAVSMSSFAEQRGTPRLPAVVLRPAVEQPIPVHATLRSAPSAFVASVSTGMAVWPALLLVEEAQSRYANEEGRSLGSLPASGAMPVNYSPRTGAR